MMHLVYFFIDNRVGAFLGLVLVLLIVYFVAATLFRKLTLLPKRPSTNINATYESAVEAVNRISSFTTWITGLQTGAIAAMGFIFKDRGAIPELYQFCGIFTLSFFATSIILATFLLCGLPSVQLRLSKDKISIGGNDVYKMAIFDSFPIKVGRLGNFIHVYFLIGIIFFSLFIIGVL